jgi:flotillin
VELLIMIGSVVVFLLLVVLLYVSRLKMPAPGEALIVYGSVAKAEGRGLKVITEGSAFVWPGIQRYTTISLAAMPFNVGTGGIRTKDGVYIQIEAPTTLKVASTREAISLAAEMFARKSSSEIVEVARKTLEGHLRAICASMTLTEVNEDRKRLQQEMQEVSASDFAKMGLHIVSFNIEKIVDDEGILQLMGKQQAAEQKSSTEIGIAQATRESAQKVAEANKLAEIARITATQEVADAQKDLDLKQAKNQQEVQTAKAITDQSYKLKELDVAQQMTEKEIAVQITKTEREAELADRQRILTQKQLTTSVEEPALAEKRKQQILAEGKVLEAEQVGKALMMKREAEGNAESRYAQTVAQATAEAKKVEGAAQAEVLQMTGAAEADRIKTKGFAEAEVGAAQAKVIREKGLAEAEIERTQGVAKAEVAKAMADAERQRGIAEAEVTEKVGLAQAQVTREKGLAEAEATRAQRMAELEADRIRMQVQSETMTDNMLKYHLIQKMPEIIAAFAGVFPKFDKVTLVDMGGQGAGGLAAVDRFSGSLVRLVGSLLPMVENMTGVQVGDALVKAFQSEEGKAAAREAGVDEETMSRVGEVIETLRFPGGKAIPLSQVQQALDANPELANMALGYLGSGNKAEEPAASEVAATSETKKA